MYVEPGDDDRLVPLLEEALAALAEEDVELRARLLARLAGALRDEPARERRDALSREAVELARRSGDPAALAYALDGRAAAIVAPDTVAECLALATELSRGGRADRRHGADRARALAPAHRAGHGRRHQEMVSGVDAMSRIADELGQPAHLWEARAGQAMLALAAGRLAEGEELVDRAFALGERAKPEIGDPRLPAPAVHALRLPGRPRRARAGDPRPGH